VRIAAGIEYVGTDFAGWQRQSGVASVQEAVERALSQVADHPVAITCAGRTDAGVHALGQVVHFDTPAVRPERGWVLGSNIHLPPGIALTFARAVADGFHARYAAISRTYRYLIVNRGARAPLLHGRACLWHAPLDAGRMQQALERVLGYHDFSAFRASECQSHSPMRRLLEARVERYGECVVLEITANAFLHHMVRNLVGAALEVGDGRREVEWLARLLEGRDRRAGHVTAPAAGLYLDRVRYPYGAGLPGRAGRPLSAIIPPSLALTGSE
jgi:tRNA pseudouridine38-40 synthase